MTRQLRVTAAALGGGQAGPVIGGDGARTTVVRIEGPRGSAELTVEADGEVVRRVAIGFPEQGFESTD